MSVLLPRVDDGVVVAAWVNYYLVLPDAWSHDPRALRGGRRGDDEKDCLDNRFHSVVSFRVGLAILIKSFLSGFISPPLMQTISTNFFVRATSCKQ